MEPVAIVGMSGRFPGAPTIEQFWRNLRSGAESLSSFSAADLLAEGVDPQLAQHPRYVNARGVLDGIEWFDASFFGVSPRSASLLDPQHRLFLECTWEALEHAGYDVDRYDGSIGVFAGCSTNRYGDRTRTVASNDRDLEGIEIRIGVDKDALAMRVAYKLDLTGPAITVQTACSTSLVAVTVACRALAHRDCDMALAGGVAITVPQRVGYLYSEGGIASPDGHCRAFDAAAAGSVGGSGCGVIVLKRLSDAVAERDTIYAVITGAAMNNDGADKIGFTAPSVTGQTRVIRRSHAAAGITANDISYVECHGTGTRLGDPIELAALAAAFAERDRAGRCAIGSVKTNIGHLDAAAGVAGLIKTVLALRHEELPASLHFRTPNPESHLESTPFVVNDRLTPWPRGATPRRAGVSSFGIGGTNAHIVLEEAPSPVPSSSGAKREVVLLSAKTPTALEAATEHLAAHLDQCDLAGYGDLAYTLQIGRRQFIHRRMVSAATPTEAAAALRGRDGPRRASGTAQRRRRIAFLFPGQGAQRLGTARELYDIQPVYREAIDRCTAWYAAHGSRDLIALLSSDLDRTSDAQPALFAIEYALATLWMSCGAQPSAMLGHSLGEFVAAHLSGVMALEDALWIVEERGRLMEACPPGAMTAVAVSEMEARAFLDADIDLASVNARGRCVLAGPEVALTALEHRLTALGIVHRRMQAPRAFHSRSMQSAADALRPLVASIALHPPRIPIVSSVTGTWLEPAQAQSPDYWATQVRHAVRFGDGLDTVAASADLTLLEVGPGGTLTALARGHLAGPHEPLIVQSLADPRDALADTEAFWKAAGRLWVAGHPIDWPAVRPSDRRSRVAAPTYPFERQRHWIDVGPAPTPADRAPSTSMTEMAPTMSAVEGRIIDIWQAVLGLPEIGVDDDFFQLGGESLLLLQMAARVREAIGVEVGMDVFFEARTIRALASRIQVLRDTPEGMPDEDLAARELDALLADNERHAGEVIA